MVQRGDVVVDPVTGEVVTYHRTAADTGGSLLRYEVRARPGTRAHVGCEKGEVRLEVLSGLMEATAGGAIRLLGCGERLRIPPGTPHGWRNAGTEDLRIVVEVQPAP